MSYYPSFKDIISAPDKNRLLEVRRSLLSIIPNIVYFLISLGIVGLLEYYFYDVEMPDVPVIRHLSLRWLAIIPIIFLLEVFRRYHNDLYIFADHRLTHLEGRLSLSYSVPMINYSDVRAIVVDQDIFGRILDYGTIAIGTAAVDGNELIMHGVRAPVELASIVDEFRNHSKSQRADERKSMSSRGLTSSSKD
ncbi:MAG: PH domain-containing protein [Oligoflexia bacterium]|nr:PH domain-containing protein [Oligoflexia bacterium]